MTIIQVMRDYAVGIVTATGASHLSWPWYKLDMKGPDRKAWPTVYFEKVGFSWV